MRISREQMLMEMAIVVSKRGTCLRRKVGAVIARDGRVISLGYVGAPRGMNHCTPATCTPERPCERTVHAEANAIAAAAKAGISTDGATLFTTVSPCLKCAQLILNVGIIEVVYLEEYRDNGPICLLRGSNILCNQLTFETEL